MDCKAGPKLALPFYWVTSKDYFSQDEVSLLWLTGGRQEKGRAGIGWKACATQVMKMIVAQASGLSTHTCRAAGADIGRPGAGVLPKTISGRPAENCL